MSKATPGKPYTVKKGDNLSRIANQAYGDPSKWRLIYKANQTVLKSSDPNLIYPGEVLQIPGDPSALAVEASLGQASEEYLPGKGTEEFTLIVAGKELVVESARVIRTMDTVSDGWSARISWDPDDTRYKSILKPYTYPEALVYLGPHLAVKGRLYIIRPELSPDDGYSMVLEGFSSTADLMDSSVKPPYEQKKVTLEQRARDLVEPLGLSVVFDVDDDEAFDRVTAQKEESIFDHLASLAKQRKVLMSSTRRGELIFYRARVGRPVATITDTLPPHRQSGAVFDGRKRYNSYRAIGPTPKRRSGNSLEAVAKDDAVPMSRFLTFSATDATAGDIQSIANWKRSAQLAEALTVPFPVNDWYAADGSLWQENTIVTAKSKAIFTPDGFDFLIKSVEYVFEEGGRSATLSLVPPQVFTGEPIEEPWR